MFCTYCGSPLPDNARFCQACGKPVQAYAAPVVQQVAQVVPRVAQAVQQAAPAVSPAAIPANVVPKKIPGKRTIITNRAFTHDELLQFLLPRWDTAQYNHFITDPSMKRYTDLYIVLPGTPRNAIIISTAAAGGLFSKNNSVSVSYIKSSAGAWEMMMRSIPTQNAFFGLGKIASTMSEKAEREGPTDEAVQRYADYLHYLLGQAGYLA